VQGKPGIIPRLAYVFHIREVPTIKKKGRDYMNIFTHETSIVGDVEMAVKLEDTSRNFWKQAEVIRKKLGNRKYLLDEYLASLFEAVSLTQIDNVTTISTNEGFALVEICTGIVHGEAKRTEHPFYPNAKTFIDEHPLQFLEPLTKVAIYWSLLAGKFYEAACKDIADKILDLFFTELDLTLTNEIYETIGELLGEEKPMESLNMLFRQRFLLSDAITIFIQGASPQIVTWLEYRDKETSRQIFQLLLDENLL
jgi:hypothetical protein